MSRRTAERRTGIVAALQHLPLLLSAYEAGKLGLEAAWLVRRILGPGPVCRELEEAWLARARDTTVKRLRDELRRADLLATGSLDLDEPEAQDDPRWPATDAAWQASLRREPGMARERVARLGRLALDPERGNVFLRLHLPEEIAIAFLASVECGRRRLANQAALAQSSADGSHDSGSAASEPGGTPSWRAARERLRRGGDVPAWVGLLSLLEDYVRTWDDTRAFPLREWDDVYDRDGWRCVAPGCTGRRHMHDHHIVYRSRLGSDELWNQLCLCAFHHSRGAHGKFAHCRGSAPLDVIWRLGRPELGTWYRNERRLMSPMPEQAGELPRDGKSSRE